MSRINRVTLRVTSCPLFSQLLSALVRSLGSGFPVFWHNILGLGFTHRPLSSSFLGLPCRILNINHKKELLRGGFRPYYWSGVLRGSHPDFWVLLRLHRLQLGLFKKAASQGEVATSHCAQTAGVDQEAKWSHSVAGLSWKSYLLWVIWSPSQGCDLRMAAKYIPQHTRTKDLIL